MSDPKTPGQLAPAEAEKLPLDQRIARLRGRKPVDINHGEALLLQGLAEASLREQRLAGAQVSLD